MTKLIKIFLFSILPFALFSQEKAANSEVYGHDWQFVTGAEPSGFTGSSPNFTGTLNPPSPGSNLLNVSGFTLSNIDTGDIFVDGNKGMYEITGITTPGTNPVVVVKIINDPFLLGVKVAPSGKGAVMRPTPEIGLLVPYVSDGGAAGGLTFTQLALIQNYNMVRVDSAMVGVGGGAAIDSTHTYGDTTYLYVGSDSFLVSIATNLASGISVTDAGEYFTGTEVETVLQEIGTRILKDTTAFASAGQSNMAGTGTGGDTSLIYKYYVVYDSTTSNYVRPDLTEIPFSLTAGRNNLAFHFAQKLGIREQSYIKHFHYAKSGSSITPGWCSESQDSLYKILDNQITESGEVLDYFLWLQGEQDQSETDAWYISRFDSLYQKLMAESWCDTNTIILVGGLAGESGKTSALKKIGGGLYFNVVYVPSLGLEDIGDNVHFTGQSLVDFGKRFYESAKLPSWHYGTANEMPYYNATTGRLTSDATLTYTTSTPNSLTGKSFIDGTSTISMDFHNGRLKVSRSSSYLALANTFATTPPNSEKLYCEGRIGQRYTSSDAFTIKTSAGLATLKVGTSGGGLARLNLHDSAGGGNYFFVNSTATENGDRFGIFGTGQVSINNSTPNTSSILDITSTTRGFLQPRLTTTQRDAISTPATGLSVYNTTTNFPNYYDGTAWRQVVSKTLADATYLTTEVDGSTTNELQTIDVSQLSGTELQLSLSSDGEATKTIDFAGLQDSLGFISSSFSTAMTVVASNDTLINTGTDFGYFSNVPSSTGNIYTISYTFEVGFDATSEVSNVFSIPLSSLGISFGTNEEPYIIGSGSIYPLGTVNSTTVSSKVIGVQANVTDEEIEVAIWHPASLGANNRARIDIICQAIKQ